MRVYVETVIPLRVLVILAGSEHGAVLGIHKKVMTHK